MDALPFDLVQRAGKHPLHIQQRALGAPDGLRGAVGCAVGARVGGDRLDHLRAFFHPVAGHMPFGLRRAQPEFGTGGNRVAEFFGQIDQPPQ